MKVNTPNHSTISNSCEGVPAEVSIAEEPANEAKQAENGGILVGDPPTEFTDCWVINSPEEGK